MVRARSNSGRTIRFPTQKSRALFGYLALHPGEPQPREKLIDLFWGSREESRGRNSLSQAATALVDPQISGDLAIYPDESIIERLHSVNILPPKLERIRSRSWTKIKTGL